MKNYRKFFYSMLIIVILSSLISLISPICLQLWTKKGISLDSRHILMIVAILFLSNILNVLLIVYRERFAKHYNKQNFIAMITDFLHMDYDSITSEGPSNMLEKIVTATNQIYLYMTGTHIQIWSSVIIAVISLGLIVSVNPIISLIMLAYVPVSYLGYRLLNKELSRRSKCMQEETGKGFQELMSFLMEPDYYKQLPDYSEIINGMLPATERIYGSMARVNEFAQSASSALQGVGSMVQNVIMLLVVYLFYQGTLSPFFLMMITIILPLYFNAVTTITNSNIQKADYTIAKALHSRIIQSREKGDGLSLDSVDSLEIRVSKLIISGKMLPFEANAILQKGDIGQLCGFSGTGKSTFAKALVRFRDIDGVQINGKLLSAYSLSALRSKIEYVSQNIPIISGTLRDNIFFGKKTSVTDMQLLDNPILKTLFASKSLDTQILEGGANLSGGEKQKIAIARALLNNPEILILDEVCSNIDMETSRKIYQLLEEERAHRITIIISHDILPEGFANISINTQK